MISKKIEWSIAGFNGSKNCDHSSVDNFFGSYIKRLHEIYEDRHFKLSNGTSRPEKRLAELQEAEWKIAYAKENEEEVKELISNLLSAY